MLAERDDAESLAEPPSYDTDVHEEITLPEIVIPRMSGIRRHRH